MGTIFLFLYNKHKNTQNTCPSSVFIFEEEKNTKTHKTRALSNFFVFLKTQKHTKHMHHSNSLKEKTQKHIKHMGSFLSIIFLYFYIINTKTHKIHAPLQFLLLKKKHKNTQNTCLFLFFLFS